VSFTALQAHYVRFPSFFKHSSVNEGHDFLALFLNTIPLCMFLDEYPQRSAKKSTYYNDDVNEMRFLELKGLAKPLKVVLIWSYVRFAA
jgi:hypothetical protein